MRRFISCLVAGIAVAVAVGSSSAGTHVVSVNSPGELAFFPLAKIVPVDLGAELHGINGVSVRVTGLGGGGSLDCDGVDYDGWHDFEIDVLVGGSHNIVKTTNLVSFDTVGSQSFFEVNPWEYMEGTSGYALGISVSPVGVPRSIGCEPAGAALPRIDLIELTIESDTIVPSREESWGTVKVRYY